MNFIHEDSSSSSMEESWELLEIEMNLIDTSLEEGPKLIVDDKSQEEIIIDEILSMPLDTLDVLITDPKVPDRLLTPLVSSRDLDQQLSRPHTGNK